MKISFIIPVYNCKNSLEKCVISIRQISNYTRHGQEIVLIDDGSTDGSSKLCDDFGDIVIHQKNAGVSAARNRGLEAATGEYVTFIDSDDYVNSKCFAEIIESLGINQNIDVAIYGMCFDYFKDGKYYRTDTIVPPMFGIYNVSECMNHLSDLFESNMLSSVCNKLIKRNLLESTLLRFRIDMFLYEDLDFSLRLLEKSNIWCLNSNIVYHYIHFESNSKANRRISHLRNLTSLIKIIEEDLKVLMEKKNGCYENQSIKVFISLYLTLLSGKIAVSDRNTILAICEEFSAWIDQNHLYEYIKDNEYAMLAYAKKVNKLLIRKSISAIRHSVAVKIKSTVGDFRKWHK